MCKMISSESIIGNFLLAALEKGDDRINVDKLFMFESLLGSNLNHLNYFTCLNYMNILDFVHRLYKKRIVLCEIQYIHIV